MANTFNEQVRTKIQNFSVETVRNILNMDNKGIAKLCAQVSLMPKKDPMGRTYFSKDDVEILRRTKSRNENAQKVQRSSQKSYATVPMKTVKNQPQSQRAHIIQPPVNEPVAPAKAAAVQKQNANAMAVEKICSSLSKMEDNITDKISDIIQKKLDEKLDGMDEVVVELVRCKTENETLRYKMNELNKEVYNLKNELSRFKALGLGFYVKKSGDSSLL